MISSRQARPQLPQDRHEPEAILQLNDAMSELNARVEKLEEERDFYRALLESPNRAAIQPPPLEGPAPTETDGRE